MGGESGSLKVALIGTGLFAKSAYSPLLRQLSNLFEVKYVWSRSDSSAKSFAEDEQDNLGGAAASHGEAGFHDILKDASIQALVIVLPVPAAQPYIDAGLAAGKHVLSEKPVAATLEEATRSLQAWHKLQPRPVWAVAENFRFEDAAARVEQLLPQLGTVLKADLLADFAMRKGHTYFESSWRRDTDAMPGGYMTEGGIHHLASLRRCLGSPQPLRVRAVTATRDEVTSSPDTLVGSIEWDTGVTSSVSFTLPAAMSRKMVSVTGSHGTIELSTLGWKGAPSGTTLRSKIVSENDGSVQDREEQVATVGMERELQDFHAAVAQAIASGEHGSTKLGDATEAFVDLAIIKALLEAGETGQVEDVQPVPV